VAEKQCMLFCSRIRQRLYTPPLRSFSRFRNKLITMLPDTSDTTQTKSSSSSNTKNLSENTEISKSEEIEGKDMKLSHLYNLERPKDLLSGVSDVIPSDIFFSCP
jgi:hypothetical protein